MKIKTSELEGAALDWAVAKAVGEAVEINSNISWGHTAPSGKPFIERHEEEPWPGEDSGYMPYSPSTDWSQLGPLLAENYIELSIADECYCAKRTCTSKYDDEPSRYSFGDTYLIAACRAIVSAKLGDTVDVPDELL